MVKLFYQPVNLLDVGSAALRNTLSTAVIKDFRICSFFGRHAFDDRFDALEGVIVDVYVLDSLANAWYHRRQVFKISHFLYLFNLFKEIVKVEFVLLYLLLQALCLFFVELLLGSFNQRYNVAHAQDAVGHTFGMENIDGFHLLARTNELDGLSNNRANA